MTEEFTDDEVHIEKLHQEIVSLKAENIKVRLALRIADQLIKDWADERIIEENDQ